jgi:putative tryptophan/tyrosine transport system substrate-binding protein
MSVKTRGRKDMSGKVVGWLLITVMLAAVSPAHAQEPKKIPRIGFLAVGRVLAPEKAFLQGLGDLGYIDGQTITIDYRFADGKVDRLPQLAEELVRLKPDLIVARATPAAHAAKNATTTIPIVILGVADAVGSGLVASLARPGGNITGTTNIMPELAGKRLDLLKEILPKPRGLFGLWARSDTQALCERGARGG